MCRLLNPFPDPELSLQIYVLADITLCLLRVEISFFVLPWQVTRRSGRQQGSISFEIHLRESPTLLKVHDMIPTEPPSKASGGYYEPSAPPETQPQSQPQQQGLGSYERASWKASRKTAAQEKQYSPPNVASNPVPRNRVYAFQSPNPRTESKSLLSSFS